MGNSFYDKPVIQPDPLKKVVTPEDKEIENSTEEAKETQETNGKWKVIRDTAEQWLNRLTEDKRLWLIAGGIACIVIALLLGIASFVSSPSEKMVNFLTDTPPGFVTAIEQSYDKKHPMQYSISLGPEESIPSYDLKYIPDGHISKLATPSGIDLFVTALNKTYLMSGTSLSNAQFVLDSQGEPSPVLQPEGNSYEKSYAGFGSVFENPYTHTLLGIYHAEIRTNPDASNTQVASIALATSKDGGKTWQREGQIITGKHILPLGKQTSGAGAPSAVIQGDYIYVYYVDWSDQQPNAIHVARSALSDDGRPGTWKKYYQGGFTEPGIGGKSDPVLLPPTNARKKVYYTSLPSISYNTKLGQYLMIFETNLGFYSALSRDGITWYDEQLFFQFPKDTAIPKQIGDTWYSYPTYLSDNTPTDMITTDNGYLYFSKGIFGQYHLMVRRKVTIK